MIEEPDMKQFLRFASIVLALIILIPIIPMVMADEEPLAEVSADRTEGTTGEQITWTVSPSAAWAPATCAYLLYRDMQLIDYQPASGALFYQYTPDTAGRYRLIVCASDGAKSVFVSSGDVLVLAPLRIVSVAANRPRISLGSVATWTARAKGGDGKTLFAFFIYRNGVLLELRIPDDPESGILNYTPEKPGTYTVDVLASSSNGKAKMAGATIVVTEGESKPLALTSVYADAPDVLLGEEIVWSATASGGNETIAFTFFLYKDGELLSFAPVGTSSVFRVTPAEPGVYAVSVHANSGLENANLMSGNVTVVQPGGIRLTSVTCNRNKAVLGEPLTWTAQTDGALGTVDYSFALYRDWKFIGLYETSSSPTFSFTPEAAGTYSVIAYAKDGLRSASAPSADVLVVSTGLFVESVTTDQLTGAVGKPITWTVHTTGGKNLKYMYFVYMNWELVYSSGIMTESTFTYTPNGTTNFYRYYIEGIVSDGEQMVSFKSPVLPVAVAGRPRILSIVPDRTTSYPGQKITWTVEVDYGADLSDEIGQIAFWLFHDSDETAVDYTEYASVTSYAFTPTQPGKYLLHAAIDTGSDYLVAEALPAMVIDPTSIEFDIVLEPGHPPDIVLNTATPAPTPPISQITLPDVDFSAILATTRPPMAPEKPNPTPTPAPTVNTNLPKTVIPNIRLP